jgi:hypothetical protein
LLASLFLLRLIKARIKTVILARAVCRFLFSFRKIKTF